VRDYAPRGRGRRRWSLRALRPIPPGPLLTILRGWGSARLTSMSTCVSPPFRSYLRRLALGRRRGVSGHAPRHSPTWMAFQYGSALRRSFPGPWHVSVPPLKACQGGQSQPLTAMDLPRACEPLSGGRRVHAGLAGAGKGRSGRAFTSARQSPHTYEPTD
jgi:hypothetical protein